MSLKEMSLVTASLVLGICLALLDLSLFFMIPGAAFPIHNLLALGIGGSLVLISYGLLRRITGYRYVLLMNIIVGMAMIIIHSTKLITGKCS
jgi:hypothetical protein